MTNAHGKTPNDTSVEQNNARSRRGIIVTTHPNAVWFPQLEKGPYTAKQKLFEQRLIRKKIRLGFSSEVLVELARAIAKTRQWISQTHA